MTKTANWFLKGYMVVALLFIYAPVFSLILISFQTSKIQAIQIDGYTTRWYWEALSNREFRDGVTTSIKVGLAVAVLSTVLGFKSAHILSRRRLKMQLLYIALVCIPVLIPLLLSGMALLMYYQQIRLEGSIWAIIIAHTCYCAPFAMGLIWNSYERLNEEIEQAAINLGASRFRVIRSVVLPQIWPAVVSAAIVSFLLSWDEFVIAWYVGGFTKTLPTIIYNSLGTSFNPSVNAIGVLSMGASALLLLGIFSINHLYNGFRRWK